MRVAGPDFRKEQKQLQIAFVDHKAVDNALAHQAQLNGVATPIPRALHGFECSKAGERLHHQLPALILGFFMYVHAFVGRLSGCATEFELH